MGETVYEDGVEAFAEIVREGETQAVPDGAVAKCGTAWGTYIHGLFDDDQFRHEFLAAARERFGLAPPRNPVNVTAEREARIDGWAEHLRQSLDMDLIRGWTRGAA
jgi:adenosylcobyric acid synthase